MFLKAAADEPAPPGMSRFQNQTNKRCIPIPSSPATRYKMHGISHLGPEDVTAAPPPTHHGIRAAIGAHPLAAKWRDEPVVESGGGSMESIIKTLEEERRGAQTKVAKPVRPPSKPPSSASSLLDLSQPHIRLSPLQVRVLTFHTVLAVCVNSFCSFFIRMH